MTFEALSGLGMPSQLLWFRVKERLPDDDACHNCCGFVFCSVEKEVLPMECNGYLIGMSLNMIVSYIYFMSMNHRGSQGKMFQLFIIYI